MENYASAAWVQIPLDLAGCLLLADFAGRIAPVLTGQTIPAPLGAWKVSPSESMLCQKLEHFRKLCRPVLHWYPTHFPNKRGNGRGTGVYSKSKNALAFYFGAASRSGSEFHSGSVPSSKFAPGSGAEARSCSGFCSGAAHGTLWLAALCPFTAIYAAQPLTESLTLFVLALALWSAARFNEQPGWSYALWFTFAVTYAALLRPDGALIGVALAPALVIGWRRGKSSPAPHSTARKAPGLVRMALVCTLLALAPFAAWSWRNWQVFQVFEPLAPRLANDPGEETHPGWELWVKSWCVDFVSTYEVYWNVPGGPLDVSTLPSRAFDSPTQRAETAALAADYNRGGQSLTPAIDARFGRLAAERNAAHPLRSALWLPLGRMADMWLRPRVENLPIELDWWVYEDHPAETLFSWAYVGLNALYLLLGLAGLCLRPRFWGPIVAYFLLRSALLMTVEAPESRYTIECFPMLFALGGVTLHGAFQRGTMLWRKHGRAAS
jgi:hypothetical protein